MNNGKKQLHIRLDTDLYKKLKVKPAPKAILKTPQVFQRLILAQYANGFAPVLAFGRQVIRILLSNGR